MKYKIVLFYLCSAIFLYGSDIFFYQNGKKIYLNELKTVTTFSTKSYDGSNINYFQTSSNQTVGVTNEILLKTDIDINILLKKYNLILLKQLTSTIYKVKVKNSNLIFDIANQLYNDKMVKYAHPNFIKKIYHR